MWVDPRPSCGFLPPQTFSWYWRRGVQRLDEGGGVANEHGEQVAPTIMLSMVSQMSACVSACPPPALMHSMGLWP